MKQAILITAYKNFGHLYDLVNSFQGNDFLYFIHIDKKSRISDDDLKRLESNENVKYISREYTVNWGGINHLKAILLLLKEAFKYEQVSYFHLITGHDYPIKSSEEIISFLSSHPQKEFMEFNKFPYHNWHLGGFYRISYYSFYDLFDGKEGWRERLIKNLIKIQMVMGIRRSFPYDFPKEIYGGSTYWTLSRQAVAYVFDYMKNHHSYLKRFKYTFCSEEIFFQTILMNSPFKENVVNDNLRFIVWEERNGNIPANLDETDYENIKNSSAFFARKFEYPVSKSLLQKIKQGF